MRAPRPRAGQVAGHVPGQLHAATLALVVLALPACSHQQLHEAGRAHLQARCMHIGNRDERARCEEAAGQGYGAYSREYESAVDAGESQGDMP